VQFIQTEQFSKILAHFKGSECEIAFLKFKSKICLFSNLWGKYITSKSIEGNGILKKTISHSEPYKWARILDKGSIWINRTLLKMLNFFCVGSTKTHLDYTVFCVAYTVSRFALTDNGICGQVF
jgi:hypothetical protein